MLDSKLNMKNRVVLLILYNFKTYNKDTEGKMK